MASHDEITAMLADIDTQLPEVSPIKSPKRPRDETSEDELIPCSQTRRGYPKHQESPYNTWK